MILIVEDTEAQAKVFGKFLNLEGFENIYTCSGEEGLKLIPKLKPELLILDYVLPEMNGSQFIEKARTEGFSGPVICISGVIDIKNLVTKDLFDKVLQKPIRLNELVETVREFV